MTASRSAATGPRRSSSRLAPIVGALALLLDVGALLLLIPQGADAVSRLDGNTLGGYVLGATYPIVGWIIASRRPGNAIGWIFLVIGLSQSLDTFAGQYATVGIATHPGSLPAADVLSWVAVWAWTPGFSLLLTVSVLLFPDGRLPSRRWWPVPWMAGLALLLIAVPIAIVAWPSRGVDLLGSGPVRSSDPTVSAMLVIQFAGLILLAVTGIVSVAGMIIRFRRSRGVERAQLKWYAAAGTAAILALIASVFFTVPGLLLNALLTVIVSPLLPIAATMAILRYRLYDIDRIVSRSVSYLAVTAVLAVVFAGLVIAFQAVLAPFTRSNGVAVAGSTLVVAAGFQPLRRRVQAIVDRRFNRARYDADQVIAGLAARLRGEVELDALADEVGRTTQRALDPSSTALWLRTAGER